MRTAPLQEAPLRRLWHFLAYTQFTTTPPRTSAASIGLLPVTAERPPSASLAVTGCTLRSGLQGMRPV